VDRDLDLGDIVMRTSRDTHLAAAAVRGDVLAFEVDDFDLLARTGSSVVVVGQPVLVVDAEDLARIRLVLDPWPPGKHDICIRLPMTVVTGRRVASSWAGHDTADDVGPANARGAGPGGGELFVSVEVTPLA